jgi:phospholipid-translocating ATPase
MFLAVILFNDSFVIIMTITFTTLIFIEFLNVIQEVTIIRRRQVIAIVTSLFFYIASIYLFSTLFQTTTFDIEFLLKVLVITLASWAPIWIVKTIVEWVDPPAVMKVRKSEIR